MPLNVKSRWSAFAIHLSISVLIAVVLLSIIFFIWFPRDLIFAGGINGLKILLGVDLVLGPLLTLLVFKHGKKSLKFDLICIGLLQVGCLSAGLWLIYNERPVMQVLADDGVHLLAASDFKAFKLEPEKVKGEAKPPFVMLDMPESVPEIAAFKVTTEIIEGKPFVFRQDLYLAIQDLSDERFLSRIEFIQQKMGEQDLAQLQDHDHKNQSTKDNCSWLPLRSKHNLGFACVNQQRGVIKLSNRQL